MFGRRILYAGPGIALPTRYGTDRRRPLSNFRRRCFIYYVVSLAERNLARHGRDIMNVIDREFALLAREIRGKSEEELFEGMKAAFLALPPASARSLERFFNAYGYWGRLDAEADDFEELRLKANVLHSHIDDFEWVYGLLSDFRSRRTLTAVLANWLRFDTALPTRTRETLFDEYFDLDILTCTPDEVVADLGAYVGDTVLSYMVNYGKNCYKRIYAYEITPSSFDAMRRNLAGFRDIEMRRKGVADAPGRMRVAVCEASSSANTLSDAACGDEVEVTTLDLDITEPISLIIADIEGGEYAALLGARRHIGTEHPRLAVSVYHRNEDLFRIPRLITSLSPAYTRFHLRHRGSPLYPTELTLFAL